MKIYLDNNLGVTKVEQEELTQDTIGYNILKVYIPNTVLTPYDTFTCYYGALLQNGRKVGWFAMEARTSTDADYEANYTLYKATLEQCVVSVEGKVYIGCQVLLGNSGNATLIKKNTAVVQFNVRKSVAINNDILVLDTDQTTTDVLESYKNLLENALTTYATKAEVYTQDQINALLLQKQNVLTFDSTPTANSTNPVTSGGVKTALDTKADSTTVSGIDNRVGVLETDVDTLQNNTYTKTQVDSALATKADRDATDSRFLLVESAIDDLISVQNVVDIVPTYSALQSYDTSKLEANDKLQVIADETHSGASTIYNWSGSAWVYVGAFGTNSYTIQEINNYKKMWDNLVYSCGFTIDDSAKTMTISGNWAFTKYSFIVIDNIAVKTISYANLSLGNYCLVIRNNALEFVNFANAIQDGDMVLWIGFLDSSGDIRTDIYRCNNKVTNLALYCSDNIKIDTTNKNFVIPSAYLFWNSGYASITAQNISYASYLNATCVLVYRNGVFKVLGLQNIELFYNDVIVAVVWFRGDGFPMSKIYVVNEAPDKAITELPLSSKIFMRVGVIGDSYTSGWIKDNDHKNNPNYSWVKHMKQLTGNEWTNFGVSGSSTKSWVDGTLGQLPQVQTKGNKCQAYVIGLMINDQNQGMQTYVPLGTSSDIGTNANSYYAYYYKLINALLSVNSSAIIFCNTCPRTDGDFPSYNQAVIDVVNYCQNENKNVYLVELRNYYWRNETFNNDALNGHYTAIGYEYMAEIFNKAFSDTINANASSLKEINLIPYDNAETDLSQKADKSNLCKGISQTQISYSNTNPNKSANVVLSKLGGMSYKSENLLALQDVVETTENGITWKIQNGVVTINGTATTEFNIGTAISDLLAGTYSSLCIASGTNTENNYWAISNSSITAGNIFKLGNTNNETNTQTTNLVGKYVRYLIKNGSTFTNATFKFMLVKGSTSPTTWSEGFTGIRDSAVTSVVSKNSNNTTIDTLAIPTAIQNLTGYGWGIDNTCYNYIDFDRKVFVQKVGRAILNGSESWAKSTTTNVDRYTLAISTNNTSNAICNHFTYSRNAGDYTIGLLVNNVGVQIVINFATYGTTTLEQFKEWLSFNNIYLYYELATPVEMDISAYLTTDTIDVEPLGTIEFLNTYNQAVPNKIAYLFNAVTLNNVVDSYGNPRFIEGNGVPLEKDGFTPTYCKWSLSGTHLMLVLAGAFANGIEIVDGTILATFTLPDFILNKIYPVWDNTKIETKNLIMYASNWSTQTLPSTVLKYNGLQIVKSGGSALTLTADRNFRIQFDLLIDNE